MTAGTEVYLARHGETDWNTQQRFQGQTDIGLNARGLEQATRLGRRMARVPIDAIYSSDLMRAVATAKPSADAHGEQVRPDVRLRERHFGMFEGHTYSDIQRRFPEQYLRWQQRDSDFALEGGESLKQVLARIRAGLDDLAAMHRGDSILIVTHGGVLDLVYRYVNHVPLEVPRAWPTNNAALNQLRHTSQGWQMVNWGDEEHLID